MGVDVACFCVVIELSFFLRFNICYFITLPITFVVGGFGNVLTYPITKSGKDISIEDEVLHEMIDEGEEEGIIDEDKAELLRGAVDFATTELYEVMTPRTKIYAVEKEAGKSYLILGADGTLLESRDTYINALNGEENVLLNISLTYWKFENA